MIITMKNNSSLLSLPEIEKILKSCDKLEFEALCRGDRNHWIQSVIMHNKYFKCSRPEKKLLKKYIIKMTGLSDPQVKRLTKEYKKRGTLKVKLYKRNFFVRIYTITDIALLAKVDNAHSCLSGPATKRILEREFIVFNKLEYENLKNISVAQLYRLKQTQTYRNRVIKFSKTRSKQVPIGERKKPEPNGEPGYLCVDTVHQGDKEGQKGIYHINIVDMVTQFEFIGSVDAISESRMKKILKDLIEQFPFIIHEFHSDNGSEYINKIVVKLLNKLLIKLTKSRPRKTNDNPLIESKNGAIIRKHMGYIHIPRYKAEQVNQFYKRYFNTYLNYHRPCAFPRIKIDKKGKEKRYYPKEDYMTPYDKLKSLEHAEDYLKQGMTFEQLDKIAFACSDTEYAIILQQEKVKLFKRLFTNG